MNDEKQKETELGNSILAVLGGAAATILTAWILIPVIQLIADNFWEWELFGQKKGITVNDIIFYGSLILFAFIAALAGGFASSLICRSYEYSHALILAGLYLVFLLFSLFDADEIDDLPSKFISLIIVGAGFLSGTKIGVRMKHRRKNKQNSDL